MKLMGFNLTRIEARKNLDKTGNFKIDTKINLLDIKKIKIDLFKSNEDLIGINFKYSIIYSENLGKIVFEGNIVISIDSKEVKSILKEWENKELSENFKTVIFNIILKKCNVKALNIEDEMNFPLHIPFPVLKNPQDKNIQDKN